ncbi:MAG: hypothetical protein Q6K70_08560, partial [Thermostichales cyanobacterium DRC_bins_46]
HALWVGLGENSQMCKQSEVRRIRSEFQVYWQNGLWNGSYFMTRYPENTPPMNSKLLAAMPSFHPNAHAEAYSPGLPT